ncbi:hypothetical protein [Micromonospora sp. URMC 106]|uniref:hypothetical protein n=1 Tax=Micromonospora sp. URMC 106 TaxID=3423408 RepID=UPI003F535688
MLEQQIRNIHNISAERDVHITFVEQRGGDYEILPSLVMKLEHEDKATGAIAELMPEIDRRSVRKISFIGAVTPKERIMVTLSREDSYYGAAQVIVESTDPGWTRQAFSELADEIDKGVPRWAYMQEQATPTLLTCSLTSGLLAAGVALAAPLKEIEAKTFLAGVIALLLTAFLFLGESVRNWFFPRFEVLGEGAQPSGTRRLVALGLVLISVPIGLWVNMVS